MGSFIVFEGCEGVGKSTQLRLMAEYLEKTNQPAHFTREPGGSELAEKVRKIILTDKISAETEAYLFAVARIDHIDNVIKPMLDQGKIVICDRYIDSSFAYQGVARDMGIERVAEINKYAVDNMMPDAVVFLDMSPDHSWRKQKGETVENDRIENEAMTFHLKVYEGYKLLATTEKRFISIVPGPTMEETHARIVEALRERKLIK